MITSTAFELVTDPERDLVPPTNVTS